ncbi:MAG: DNA polymerase IV [Cyclobacteriaceae bacterium]
MDRQIVHMDLDAFYVNCTLLKMPELVGKPVIIGGISNRGVVTCASYEARKYGVHSAMPTRFAKQLCPDAIILQGDFDMFTDYSNMVNEIVSEKAPVLERASIDEFYMDVSGMDRFYGCHQFTTELINRVSHETGLQMSFGLSVNKTVAKMCTNYSKPSGNLRVSQKEVQPFLDPQSIRKIPQLGDVTFKLLRRISIKVIKTLRQLPADSMQELLGKNGISIWRKANGIDSTPVIPFSNRKSISTEKTFDKDTQNIPELKALLISMVEKVAFQMRDANMLCSTITVRIRYSNRDTETSQAKVSFTSNDDVLLQKALELFDKLYNRRMLLRLVGVKLSNFVYGNHQIDIFHDTTKMINLYQAMDRMKRRFDNPKLIRRATGLSARKNTLIGKG